MIRVAIEIVKKTMFSVIRTSNDAGGSRVLAPQGRSLALVSFEGTGFFNCPLSTAHCLTCSNTNSVRHKFFGKTHPPNHQ
jgi:hypothetical protein